ncbi:MAG: hypothetical protein ACM3S4_12980 [Burkholderiales bacterium]
MKRLCFVKKNTRGSAIIMALVTMTLLVCLGLALITVSMGNLNVTVADAANNDAYYAAASGVNSAIEQIKSEAADYYNAMLQAQGTTYTQLYNNFFDGIYNNAQSRFKEPSISGVITSTSFTKGAFDPDKNECTYLVSCTATAPKDMKYKVNGSVKIRRVDVNAGGVWNVPNNGSAVIAGGTLNVPSGSGINVNKNSNISVANLNIQNSWQINYSNGGQTIIDPNIGLTINDNLKYPSYTVPAGVTEQGDVNLTGGTHYGDVYCTSFRSNIEVHGNIYCRGNVTIAGGNVYGNIICDGSVTFGSATLVGAILAKNGITTNGGTIHGSLFSPAAITTQGGTTFIHGIIYSSTKITVGASGSNGILYSGGGAGGNSGDIEITGSPTFNLIVAKRNITLNGVWASVAYSAQTIIDILADPVNSFFVSGSRPTLLDVIVSEEVSPAGSTS